jgi:hypothetical protein
MTTLATMVQRIYRDLADEAQEVFTNTMVEDFVREGIAELNRIAPPEVSVNIALTVDDATNRVMVDTYNIPIDLPYRVAKVWFDGRGTYGMQTIPAAEDGVDEMAYGFLFRRTPTGGVITFPRVVIDSIDPDYQGLNVAGYGSRPMPFTGTVSPTLSLSEEEEYLIRVFGRSRGYDVLSHDRSLFAQWQGQTNNSDVSPTQMMQMAANAANDWDRQRGLNRVVRKYWQ